MKFFCQFSRKANNLWRAKIIPKKRANGNDGDQQDQGCRKSARLAARSSISALTTETGGISE